MVLLASPLPAEDELKKPDAKAVPKILVTIPLGMAAGSTAKIALRGSHLDEASELRFRNSPATAKILSKGKAAIPDKFEAKEVGDTQVEAEVTVPADAVIGELLLTVVTPAGESAPHPILIAARENLIAGKKPGGGFRDALPLGLGQSFEGTIDHAKEVHVFRIDNAGGKTIAAEVTAARKGSPLDSLLTLYDSAGHVLATNDDTAGSTDSRIETTLPASGPCFLSLIDANDQGSPVHVYRLTLHEAK